MLLRHFTAYHPRYSYSGEFPDLETTGKPCPKCIEHGSCTRTAKTGHWYIPKLFIFMTLLPVLWFMHQGQAHFHEYSLLYFWGGFPKMAMKLSIIGLDSYIIPHFKANMSWYASVSQQCLYISYACAM